MANRSHVHARATRVAIRVATGLAVGVLLFGCDRPNERTASEAPPGVAIGTDSVVSPTDSTSGGWEAEVGDVLVLPGDEGPLNGAVVRAHATDQTLTDTAGLGASLGDRRLDLFARGGAVGVARVRVEAASRLDAGCTAWPVARLSADGGSAVRPWTAAFLTGRVEPIALDSIEALAPRDSATLAAQIARVASRLPDDTNPTFRSRPYVVQRAWISRDDPALVVALLIRRVNQEDAPREERLVLVLDQSPGEKDAWQVGWHERASGAEDELIVAEPLLAYRVRGATDAHLLFGRDDGYALSASVLVRRDRRWQVLWESAIAGCS